MFWLYTEIPSSSSLPNSPTPSSSISTVVYIETLAVTNDEDHYTSKINEPSTTTITIPVSTVSFPDKNENNEIHGMYTKVITVVRYNNSTYKWRVNWHVFSLQRLLDI